MTISNKGDSTTLIPNQTQLKATGRRKGEGLTSYQPLTSGPAEAIASLHYCYQPSPPLA